MKVIILSGVSGSGKSTWAKDKGVIFSADSFFMRDGVYHFDPKKLQEAHEANLHDFVQEVCAMEDWDGENSPIIVDNTNTTIAEIAPYYSVARAFGFQVELISFEVGIRLAADRNKHGVSYNAVKAQYERLNQLQIPRFWELKHTIMWWREGQPGHWEQSLG